MGAAIGDRLAEDRPQRASPDVLAAVDLGSNSFHMIVARLAHGQLAIVDRLREPVRLAAGLDAHNRLDGESRARALECLHRFGQRLRELRADRVRVVGTNTLRKARRARDFLADAERALGHPVEIIPGREEARLVYLGVAHFLPPAGGLRLVVDIGGGSTELILGRGFEPQRLDSLYMGCVGMTQRYFADGKLTRKRFDKARLAARLELRPVKAYFRRAPWEQVAGSSGTIRSAASVAQLLGLVPTGITPAAAEGLVERLVELGRVERIDLPGLTSDRAQVFAGGLAVLVEVLETLGIDQMSVSDGALREGLLYDMLGRLSHEDARERTVRAMAARYHVDEHQARRVAATAERLYEQVEAAWQLDGERDRLVLGWAARLHEVGLDIAYSKYHRHGGYLLEHADMPGFSRAEQRLLATVVGHHRRRLRDLELDRLPDAWQPAARRLIVLLRLAVVLHRSRSARELPALAVQAAGERLTLSLPESWLDAHALTRADLRQEVGYLAEAGFVLEVSVGPG
jgi:exopolyphosphatase/guanosine-5'-triphosphate,3'-diphosphate pyrophosphatase